VIALLRGEGNVVVVGHRGAARLAAESSIAAIEAAAANGADLVELDVVRDPRGTLVVAHGPGVPDDAPALAEALDRVRELGLGVQLDVKIAGLARDACAALRAHGLLERSFVSSYAPRILRAFAAAAPELPRSLTFPEDRLGITENRVLRPAVRPSLAVMKGLLPLHLPRRLRAVDARAATLNSAVISVRVVERCHAIGVAVFAWTVNDPGLAATLVSKGVDGIITDDPRILPPGIHRR
jgi:glycerophosphoryl diester phosphodiesterase